MDSELTRWLDRAYLEQSERQTTERLDGPTVLVTDSTGFRASRVDSTEFDFYRADGPIFQHLTD